MYWCYDHFNHSDSKYNSVSYMSFDTSLASVCQLKVFPLADSALTTPPNHDCIHLLLLELRLLKVTVPSCFKGIIETLEKWNSFYRYVSSVRITGLWGWVPQTEWGSQKVLACELTHLMGPFEYTTPADQKKNIYVIHFALAIHSLGTLSLLSFIIRYYN